MQIHMRTAVALQAASADVADAANRPELDDQVLVSFERGDVRHAYVMGSLWNSNDEPPTEKR